MTTECPNCGALWGLEEMDWNQCHSCGYPDTDDLNEQDEDDFIQEDEDEDYLWNQCGFD